MPLDFRCTSCPSSKRCSAIEFFVLPRVLLCFEGAIHLSAEKHCQDAGDPYQDDHLNTQAEVPVWLTDRLRFSRRLWSYAFVGGASFPRTERVYTSLCQRIS